MTIKYIEPKTRKKLQPIITPTIKKPIYELEDKDFLLIDAIRSLTNEIRRLNNGR